MDYYVLLLLSLSTKFNKLLHILIGLLRCKLGEYDFRPNAILSSGEASSCSARTHK